MKPPITVQLSSNSSLNYALPHELAPASTRSPRFGFSLVELLVVLGLMALMAAVLPMVFQGATNGSGVRGAVNISAGLVEFARNNAVRSRDGSRIIIDIDPASSGYLRRMAILRGIRGSDGNISWQIAGPPQLLPSNTYFYKDYSKGFELMKFDFQSATMVGSNGSGTQVAVFEYDGSGRLVVQSGGGASQMVFVSGIIENPGSVNQTLSVPSARADGMAGFILRRGGNVTHFESANQIRS